ncbi:hypothetical protein FHR90_000420 [Endobacter medicaginis]|uniref:DUF2384 domain-containing protein n=1 Tax=Endobacter medicaginis TaxID=1181271 RepID=A0A850NKD9_9PROT|nr:MbcA/ParS/Xre antitoxin family protein [Endobacter medicaginis]MBB3172606.1 hypothetical protein [Endobacter medicaginis]MCX5476859.1 MbcA/ParS/Xre antitoxin family protein [Endobacter medicaginis]NVN29384.1 DUF2384 domain-containing protein [Endobacter medicaginis]
MSTPAASSDTPTDAESAAAVKAVLALMERWQLSDSQQCAVLGIDAAQLAEWRAGRVELRPVDARSLGLLLSIHRSLRMAFTDPERGYAWVRKPNEAFAGRSALNVMCEPGGLERVAAYLAAEIMIQ